MDIDTAREQERERCRLEYLANLDAARAALLRGGGRVITPESMRELCAQVSARGRARFVSSRTDKSLG